jgi:flavin reductase (DIM6/NTAB) family NADH-FMN oxidoreductase RutF
MHQVIQPTILYFGTPFVLLSTVNEDGSFNLAPISSAWWFSQHCVSGLATAFKTTQSLLRIGQCVLNLSADTTMVQMDRVAGTTGSDPVPDGKAPRGYRFLRKKFATAGLTPIPSLTVMASRVMKARSNSKPSSRRHIRLPNTTLHDKAAHCKSRSERCMRRPTR